MTITGQIARYRATCNNLLTLFCEKHSFDREHTFWIDDEIGTVACFPLGFYFDMGTIIDDLESDAPPEAILQWYDEYISTDGGVRFSKWWREKQKQTV